MPLAYRVRYRFALFLVLPAVVLAQVTRGSSSGGNESTLALAKKAQNPQSPT
jgi:hypothetical protein